MNRQFGKFMLVMLVAFCAVYWRCEAEATNDTSKLRVLVEPSSVTTLRDLRAGDTNAVFDSLESQLDASAISLRGILDDDPSVEHAANYTNVLRRIADYRTTYPLKRENR
jgi:hypothetical protein